MNKSILKNRAIKGFAWKFLERVVNQGIRLLVSIILARLLMPDEYAVVAIALIFVTLMDVLVSNGLGMALIREEKADDYDFSTIMFANIVFSCFIYMVICLISPILSMLYGIDELTLVMRILSIKIIVGGINAIQQAYIIRNLLFEKLFYATCIGGASGGAIGILLAYCQCGVWALVGQQLVDVIVGACALFFMSEWHPRFYFSAKKFSRLYKFSWQMLLTSFIGAFFYRLKGFIIGTKYSGLDLAYYNMGGIIPMALGNNIGSVIDSVMFPVLAKCKDDVEGFTNIVRKNIRVTAFFVMPLMFFIAGIADKIILIVFTDKWIFSVDYFRISAISYCFFIMNTSNLQAIKAIGRSDVSLSLEFKKKPMLIIVLLISMNFGPKIIAIADAVYTMIALVINSSANKKLLNYGFCAQIVDIVPMLLSAFLMYWIVIMAEGFFSNLLLSIIFQFILAFMAYFCFTKIIAKDIHDYCFRFVWNIMKSKVVKRV